MDAERKLKNQKAYRAKQQRRINNELAFQRTIKERQKPILEWLKTLTSSQSEYLELLMCCDSPAELVEQLDSIHEIIKDLPKQ